MASVICTTHESSDILTVQTTIKVEDLSIFDDDYARREPFKNYRGILRTASCNSSLSEVSSIRSEEDFEQCNSKDESCPFTRRTASRRVSVSEGNFFKKPVVVSFEVGQEKTSLLGAVGNLKRSTEVRCGETASDGGHILADESTSTQQLVIVSSGDGQQTNAHAHSVTGLEKIFRGPTHEKKPKMLDYEFGSGINTRKRYGMSLAESLLVNRGSGAVPSCSNKKSRSQCSKTRGVYQCQTSAGPVVINTKESLESHQACCHDDLETTSHESRVRALCNKTLHSGDNKNSKKEVRTCTKTESECSCIDPLPIATGSESNSSRCHPDQVNARVDHVAGCALAANCVQASTEVFLDKTWPRPLMADKISRSDDSGNCMIDNLTDLSSKNALLLSKEISSCRKNIGEALKREAPFAEPNPKRRRMCWRAVSGDCPRSSKSCDREHGLWCRTCGLHVLHPLDAMQRANHYAECDDTDAWSARGRPVCDLCRNVIRIAVHDPNSMFGLLENCSHVFCLSCVEEWRRREGRSTGSSTWCPCPLCGVLSALVVPSKHYMGDGVRKRALIKCHLLPERPRLLSKGNRLVSYDEITYMVKDAVDEKSNSKGSVYSSSYMLLRPYSEPGTACNSYTHEPATTIRRSKSNDCTPETEVLIREWYAKSLPTTDATTSDLDTNSCNQATNQEE